MATKANNAGRVTVRLPSDLHAELKRASANLPGGMTEIILNRLRSSTSPNTMAPIELMPILIFVSAILDQVRDAENYQPEKMETVGLLYDTLLEKTLALLESGS